MINKTNNEIIIYEGESGQPSISVLIENETAWLTQAQLVELFDSSKANVSEHIKHIFLEKELKENSVVREFRTTAADGKNYKVGHYNLDMIISLGYRIKPKTATHFRQWATARLREYIVKGFTIDDQRLKNAGGGNYWRELLDRIRDIRSSEKALYRQVLDLYATSIDYDPKSEESILFFRIVQNKLHYATFSGVMPILSEVGIAKNYLTEDELFRLNRMVSAFFDLAEIKAKEHSKMSMKNWVKELDKFAEMYGKGVLKNAGNVTAKQAKEKAVAEYKKYQAKTLSPVEKTYLESIKSLQKNIEIKKKRSRFF